MVTRDYMQIPINPDEGFPQAFRLSFNDQVYQVALYVNVLAEAEPGLPDLMDLPREGAFMVMRVARETGNAPGVILQRKLIPGFEYEVEDVAFVFTDMTVAKANLNGAGSFGSVVVGGIAAR